GGDVHLAGVGSRRPDRVHLRAVGVEAPNYRAATVGDVDPPPGIRRELADCAREQSGGAKQVQLRGGLALEADNLLAGGGTGPRHIDVTAAHSDAGRTRHWD